MSNDEVNHCCRVQGQEVVLVPWVYGEKMIPVSRQVEMMNDE
jgi:hypothetical protein